MRTNLRTDSEQTWKSNKVELRDGMTCAHASDDVTYVGFGIGFEIRAVADLCPHRTAQSVKLVLFVSGRPAWRDETSADFLLNFKYAIGSGLKPKKIDRNLCVPTPCEFALKYEIDTHMVGGGALAARSYEKTGRSTKDKRVVREPSTKDKRVAPGRPPCPIRLLIGDDKHCWVDDGVLNIGVGCYAKCVNFQVATKTSWSYLQGICASLRRTSFKYEIDTHMVEGGALAARSYEKTGRSTKDKRVVREPSTKDKRVVGRGITQLSHGRVRNLCVPTPYEFALKYEIDTHMVEGGALAARSYEKTGTRETTLSTDPNRPLIGEALLV
eukprot:gene15590-21689_t